MPDNNDDDHKDPSQQYVPAYNLAISPTERNKLLAEKDFNAIKKIAEASNYLAAHKDDFTEKNLNEISNRLQVMLKATAALIENSPDLQELVNLERRGKNSQLEGQLTQLIELSGSNLDQDIEYGASVSAQQRLQWQALGMDPDSENEVEEFLERNGISDARQPDQENTNKMRR